MTYTPCLQMEFTHLGDYRFKGVGIQTVMQINGGAFSGREFPDKAVSSKAEHVRTPQPPRIPKE